ncbi:MAG: hypothetical protein ACI8Y4_004956 [Candidatus Poriferisodalaceae bacterium]
MCHQTVGLIARALEEVGISTLSLSSARDITRAVNPPRSAYLDFPLGHTSGRPDQPELNRDIVAAALAGFDVLSEPGSMLHMSFQWADSDDWKDAVFTPVASSNDSESDTDPGSGKYDDDRVARRDTPQYQSVADEQAALDSHDGKTCLVCVGIDL